MMKFEQAIVWNWNEDCTSVCTFEFSPFLQDCAICKGELVLVSDLNFHLDIKDDPDVIKFLDLIDSCGLTQSVFRPLVAILSMLLLVKWTL